MPDETSLVRFRNRIRESKGFNRQRLKALNHELEQRGVIIKQGTMIDAGMIESSRRPAGKKGRDTSDAQASRTKKNNKVTRGYKVAVDSTSDVVRDVVVTPANLDNSRVCDELIREMNRRYMLTRPMTDNMRCWLRVCGSVCLMKLSSCA